MIVPTEYLTNNGLQLIPFHSADQAWGYRENEPVLAFINDPTDGTMGFQNAMNMYWATAEYISKPWCLFMVTGEPMMPHQKGMLENLTVQYNIQLHEKPSEDDVRIGVKAQLDKLVSIMHRYIPEGASNPSKALGDSMKGWKDEKPALEDVFEVNVSLGDLSIYEENGELVPSRTTVPLTVTSGDVEIEGMLPRLIQSNPLIFYTEHRNLPTVFTIDLGKNTFTARFEADKGNLIEATSYESMMNCFKSDGELSFIDPNTGETVFNLSVTR